MKTSTRMESCDWLFLLYIFKWAGFWTAPTWVFILLWVAFAAKVIVAIKES